MIKIDFTLILTAFNFGILYFCLKKILFNPILLFIEKRESEIEESFKLNKETESEILSLKEEYLSKVNAGKDDADRIISSSMQKAWSDKKEKIELIQKENQVKLLEIKEKLEKSSKILNEELKKESDNFVALVVEKILGKSVK